MVLNDERYIFYHANIMLVNNWLHWNIIIVTVPMKKSPMDFNFHQHSISILKLYDVLNWNYYSSNHNRVSYLILIKKLGFECWMTHILSCQHNARKQLITLKYSYSDSSHGKKSSTDFNFHQRSIPILKLYDLLKWNYYLSNQNPN